MVQQPVNPFYVQGRGPFLDGSPEDAAHPQDWPYPEKVMGFAAHSLELFEDEDTPVPGFRTAWWLDNDGEYGQKNRRQIKPPKELFCTPTNHCYPGVKQPPAEPEEKPGPCLHQDAHGDYDLRCWYHGNATWKADCEDQCGREFIRFDPGWEYQPDADSFPPNCGTTGLPAGALVIDNLPSGTKPVREGCTPVASNGSFEFAFGSDSSGKYPSKMDTHQLGGGFNGQFYFAHTRSENPKGNLYGGKLTVTGTWSLDRPLTQWGRVMVHMPDHGAWTQQAAYTIDLGNGTTKQRVVLQRHYANQWVSLGVFHFSGTPKVTLSNVTHDGDGVDDIACDAVAIQPLDKKPDDIVVALGDSYASGEGASELDGSDYYPDSDHHGAHEFGEPVSRFRNGCHRSREAWSLKAALPSQPDRTIKHRHETLANDLDYQLAACSDAQTHNLLPFYSVPEGERPKSYLGKQGQGQYGELSQLDRGFVDENTTLVTLAISGNDARFSDIIRKCIEPIMGLCKDVALPDDSKSLEWMTDHRVHTEIPVSVLTTLEQIRLKAPRATIMLMGYPKLFETGSECVSIPDMDREWLNTVADQLNDSLYRTASRLDTPYGRVVFADPRSAFSGKSLCTDQSAINELVFTLTKGDKPMFPFPVPGPDFGLGVSQQSIHPNKFGTSLYANVMEQKIRDTAR